LVVAEAHGGGGGLEVVFAAAGEASVGSCKVKAVGRVGRISDFGRHDECLLELAYFVWAGVRENMRLLGLNEFTDGINVS
jgi:hypothetical protein